MKKKSRFLICIALCLLAVSCSNLLNRGNDDTSADNKESDTAKKSYIFKGSLNLSGAIPEFLNFEKDSSLSKSAVPNISGTDWNSYYWQIDAVSGGVTKSINSKTNSNYFTSSSNPSVVEFIFDSLDEGTWDFTASLKKLASATPASNDSTIMKDTYPNITIGDALPIVTHRFILKPSQTANTGKGSIELPMTIPSSIKKITATSTTDGWSDITLNPTTTSVTLSVSNIQSKTYEVTFSFFNANNILLYTTIQTINVFDNMKTNTWLSDGTSIFNTSNTPVTFELTETIMNQFARTSIYVGVPAGLTEVTASDITGTGSPFAPVESVTKAAQIIANTGSSTYDFRIFICGEITGAQEVKNITSEMANSITITGYSGNTNNRLKGGSSGSVLYLDTDVSVTIKNLTITGGKGTEVSSTLCGGGIYIAAGTVKLTDGAIIAGNTAANGGGVYLAGSDSNLFMYGSALIGAQADSYPTKAEDASNSADNGGGIYNNGGSVYLGYSKYVSSSNKTESDITAGYGIRRNYAVFYSGIQSEGGTVLIRSGSISNNGTKYDEDWKGYGGALGVTAVGTYTISGGTFSSNYARNGGVVYIKEVAEENKDNPIVVNISGGTFSNNTGVGGAVIRVQKYSKVVISGNPTFTGNNATASGGVIYNDYGIITMTGGTMGGTTNSDQNTCGTGYGGAIYQSGTFNLSGSAKIYSGSTKTNDVYLSSGKKITIDANYTGSGNNDESKMSVTPNTWTRGAVILDGSKLTSTNKDYFSITDAEWNVLTIGDTTLTGHLNADLYVAGSSALTIDGVSYGAGASNGKGTKSAPYSTISAAVNQCWSYDIDFTINVVGTISGSQTMPSANETNGTGLAKSITLAGIGDDTNPAKLTYTTTILSITNAKPITITGLKITGAVTASNGGGIWVGANSNVTLDGVEIFNNHSTYGGGVYNNGTLKIANAQIYGNRCAADNASAGGGVYNYGGTLYVYGDDTVIGKGDASVTAQYEPTVNANDYSNLSNYAKSAGGGIYNSQVARVVNGATTTFYGAVYIGKDPDGNLSKPKINYNFASGKGGGIYNKAGCTIEFNGGEISYNSTIANQQSTAYQGGGIYSEGTVTLAETQKQKNIKGNASYQGGAIYMTGANSAFSMGGPSGLGISSTYISIPYSDTTTDVNYKNTIYLGEKTSGEPCAITITRYIARADCSIMKIDTACSTYRGKTIVSKGENIGDGDFSSSLNKLIIKQPSGNTGYDYYISSTGVLSQPTKYTSSNKANIQPGDILMKNGDVLPFDSRMSINTDEAIGVVFHNGIACSTNSTTRILVLGVKYYSLGLQNWLGKPNTYHPTSDPVSGLKATVSGSGDSTSISGTNAINGSDNRSNVTSIKENENAFDVCYNYSSVDTNLTGNYATGWYLPSLKELWTVRQNRTIVLKALSFLSKAGVAGRVYTQSSSSGPEFWNFSQPRQYGYWCSNSGEYDSTNKEVYAYVVRLDDDSNTATTSTGLKDRIQQDKHYNYHYVLPIHEVTF